MSNDLDKIFEKIDSYRDEMIQLQKDLTAIPALSPDYEGGEGEMKKAEFILNYLNEIGLTDIKRYDAPDDRVKEKIRPNFTIRLKGKDSGRRLWIMAHMDVVPPGDLEQWKGDPWKVRIEGDNMIGRGVEDNQQGLVSGLFAVKALKELGIEPEYDVMLIFVSDEEVGSKLGIQYVLKEHDIIKKDDLIIVPDAGEPDSRMIEVAEKSILWLEIETTGKQCHGSTPEQGINSHRAAAHLIIALEELYKKFPHEDPVFDPPISTFEPTMKKTNVENINTIPGKDFIYYDCRVMPKYDIDDVVNFVKEKAAEIERKFGVTIEVRTPQYLKAAPPTPNDAPIVEMLRKGIKDVYKVDAKPMGIGGGTVAAYFREHGLNTAVWSTLLDTCHQPEETATISNMVNDTKVFAHVMLQKV